MGCFAIENRQRQNRLAAPSDARNYLRVTKRKDARECERPSLLQLERLFVNVFPGGWQVCIDLPPTATGLRHRKKLGTFTTRKEAERAERQALEARERGIDLDPAKVTLSELAERFFKAAGPDLVPATIARYEEHWRMHIAPSLGGVSVARLKAAHLAELYAKLRSEKIRYAKGEKVRFGRPLGANSVLRIHRLLHRIFGWAETLGLVQHNVARLVQAPKAAPSPDVL